MMSAAIATAPRMNSYIVENDRDTPTLDMREFYNLDLEEEEIPDMELEEGEAVYGEDYVQEKLEELHEEVGLEFEDEY